MTGSKNLRREQENQTVLLVTARMIAAVLLLFLLVTACSQPLSVEQQIIAVIREMESSVEAGERRQFIAHVAEGFSGQNGAMNRDQLNALVLYQLNRHKRLNAQIFPIKVISTAPDQAEASFSMLMTGGPGWLPDSGQMYDIVARWQLQEDEWMLVNAIWETADNRDVLDF